ncbi:MAG: hypothetical protein F9K29_06080 [Hyphomicrobiaceae bacterium]|nr:MAG: hypothetical protein F9K29_06080 [Hyphomicrobiaceae bacterium]
MSAPVKAFGREAARIPNVGASTAIRWMGRWRATARVDAKQRANADADHVRNAVGGGFGELNG